MHCDKARTAILERQLGLLGPSDEAAVELHLQSCAACSAQASLESRISTDLALLRGQYPFELDITRRVMAEIGTIGEVVRDEVPDRHLAWGAIAATLVAASLLAFGQRFLPALPEAFQLTKALARGAMTVVVDLARPLVHLLAVPFKLLASFLESAGAAGYLLDALGPVATFTAIVSCTLMAVTTGIVVGRDFLRFTPAMKPTKH